MEKYNHQKIEKKWQEYWEKHQFAKAVDYDKRPKFYGLIEFPYPSGEGLHVGHIRSNTAMDIIARKRRLQGCNVLYPMGWDAFGLPTENYAIKTGVHPAIVTKKNTDIFRRQLKSLGFSFDWQREINTTDPEYYRWTQWMFLQFFKRGLAYKKKIAINWCPSCKIGLANEEVIEGKCERCGTAAEKRDKEQWLLAITKYADRLDKDLDTVDYLEKIKIQQRNWIGRSEGALIKFPISNFQFLPKKSQNSNDQKNIEVFTTRPDTLFGATYMVLAPEHKLLEDLKVRVNNWPEVEKYIKQAKNKSDLERSDLNKEKIGVELKGIKAINPVNGEEIPIWIADYVMADYGTGAIMAVPAHDIRDFDFAKKYNLKIKAVIMPEDQEIINAITKASEPVPSKEDPRYNFIIKVISEGIVMAASVGDGILINSGEYDELTSAEARKKMTAWLEKQELGRRSVNYKLRDWIFSRQHYWGEPIPVVFCETCAKRKYNFIFIHGYSSSGRGGWRPWLKRELEKRGHKVYSPDLPNTDNPSVDEQADYIIKNAKIGKDTILIGGSLGGAVALRILEKIDGRVAKTVFVDPVSFPEFNDHHRPAVKAAHDWKFNFKKIKISGGEMLILGDQNFPIITKKQLFELGQAIDTPVILVEPKAEHFKSSEEPEILKIFENLGTVPVPEKDLPVELPKVEKYQPTDTGESPLAAMTDWVNTVCPRCGGEAKRETDTMPNWAGSSWYYLAYLMRGNPKSQIPNPKQILNSKFQSQNNQKDGESKYLDIKLAYSLFKYWLPVDWYNGGMEHTTLHLLYSRFWHKFLFDLGLVPTSEPYAKRTAHGLILAEGGVKMSKSKGNIVNPDDIVKKVGADALRIYEMFMGPFDQAIAWSTDGLMGARRFIEKIWRLKSQIPSTKSQTNPKFQIPNKKLEKLLHQTIKKVSEDIEALKFNTAISQMMIFLNFAGKFDSLPRPAMEKFLLILAPFAPHLAEELWQKLGHKQSIFQEKWPQYDPKLAKAETINLVLSVNGRVRDTVAVAADIGEEEARKLAFKSEKIKKWTQGKEVKKVIFVKGRLVNIVV